MHPLLSYRSPALTDQMADAAMRHLASAGVARMSIAVVAAGLGVTRQSLTTRLNVMIAERRLDMSPGAFMHHIVVGRLGDRFVDWSTRDFIGARPDRAPRFAAPRTPDERAGVHAWSALRELARADFCDGEPAAAQAVDEVRRREREIVAVGLHHWLGRPVSHSALVSTQCLVDGIQIAASQPVNPLAASLAQLALDRHVACLAGTPRRSGPDGRDV